MHLDPCLSSSVTSWGPSIQRPSGDILYPNLVCLFVCFKLGAVTVYVSTYLGHGHIVVQCIHRGWVWRRHFAAVDGVQHLQWAVLKERTDGKTSSFSKRTWASTRLESLQPAACPAEFSPTSQFLEVNPISIENSLSLFMVLYLQIWVFEFACNRQTALHSLCPAIYPSVQDGRRLQSLGAHSSCWGWIDDDFSSFLFSDCRKLFFRWSTEPQFSHFSWTVSLFKITLKYSADKLPNVPKHQKTVMRLMGSICVGQSSFRHETQCWLWIQCYWANIIH